MFKPSRILVPTDMSPHADKAIRQALEIAKQFGSDVFVLHVIQHRVQQYTPDYSMSDDIGIQPQGPVYDRAREGILRQVQSISPEGAANVTLDVREGVPYDEILKDAEERNVDLIVISSLGTTGLAKYLMGSVARHVLLSSKCSVLLVK
jgi:nucleotide-binding universal stress UspA family protein